MADMERLARELLTLLERETACLETTAGRFKEDRKALISGRGSVLEEATHRWQILAEDRADLDRRRALLLDRFAGALGVPVDRLNITKIANSLQGPLGHELRSAGDRVRRAAREAALQAAVGRDLLEESARFHEGLLRSISAAVDTESPAYGQKRRTGSATVTMVDRTA